MEIMVKASAVPSSNQVNNAGGFRNLRRSELGGVIFGCKNNTMKECLSKLLFGLPAQHFSYVKNIEPGLPLFLFNYTDRKLYGIYKSAGSGQMQIDPYAWTSDGSSKTPYPAQVQVYVDMRCAVLTESQFKPIIMDNYFSQKHFWFELDHVQAGKLTSKLMCLAYAPTASSILQGLPDNVKRDDNGCLDSRDLKDISTCLHSNGNEAEMDEKDLVYIKLRELALELQENNTAVINDAIVEQNVNCSFDSTGYPSVVQLLQEMEELIAFKEEHTHRMDNLEQKLAYAEEEITQLKSRCMMLESLNSVCAPVDEILIDSDDDNVHLHMKHGSILLTGGYDGISWLSSFDSYSPSLDVLKPLEPMKSARAYASVAKLSGEIYVFGGGTASLWYDTVESYNPAGNEWTLCPCLKEKKGSLASVTLNEKIFAMGGGNGIKSFSEVEMYDPQVGRWIYTQSMLQKRFALAAAELNGALYAVGGYDGSSYLTTAERFDPREHSWTKIQSMSTMRGCHSLVALSGKLYAVGGFDGSTMMPSIEIYEPRVGTWMTGEAMKHSRGYSAVAVVNESIYVIGGIQSNEEIADVIESYKEGEGWQTHNLMAVGKRCFSSAIVLEVD